MQQSYNARTPKLVGAVAIVTVTVAGAYFFILRDTSSTSNTLTNATPTVENVISDTPTNTASTADTTNTDTSVTTNTANSSTTTQAYKDGTYSATATYTVPHGDTNSVAVKLTIKDGTVTNVATNHDYSDRDSEFYVEEFESKISGTVVGKKITDVSSLSRVGGASLTTRGFDTAVSSIISQAKS